MKPTTVLRPDAAETLKNRDLAGVYCSDDESARAMFQAGPAAGFNVYRIDLGRARKEDDLHRILGKGLHFPDWYGHNWDALADCLTDMSWNEADGYLLILQSAGTLATNDPQALTTLISVLQETVKVWKTEKVAFWVLMIGEEVPLPKIGVAT